MFLNEYSQTLNGPYGPLDMTAKIDVNFLNSEIANGKTLQQITDDVNKTFNKNFTIPNIMDALTALPGRYGSLFSDQQVSESVTAQQRYAFQQSNPAAAALVTAQEQGQAAVDQLLFSFFATEITARKTLQQIKDDLYNTYNKTLTIQNIVDYLIANNLYAAQQSNAGESTAEQQTAAIEAGINAQQAASIAAQQAAAQAQQDAGRAAALQAVAEAYKADAKTAADEAAAIAAQQAAATAAAQQAAATAAAQQAAATAAAQRGSITAIEQQAAAAAAQQAAAAAAAQQAAAAAAEHDAAVAAAQKAAADALIAKQKADEANKIATGGKTTNLTPLLFIVGAAFLLGKL